VNDKKTYGFGVDLPLGYVGATYLIGRRGLNGNAVAAETFLQVSRHATPRAEGWLHSSREPTGLPLAGESGCAVNS
jgi:hypothetical protein